MGRGEKEGALFTSLILANIHYSRFFFSLYLECSG